MNLVMDISDRIYVLDFGKLISEGTPQLVRDDPAVIAAYLGWMRNESAGSEGPGGQLRRYRGAQGISFSVDEGQIVTLIGANGAGKSTTSRHHRHRSGQRHDPL